MSTSTSVCLKPSRLDEIINVIILTGSVSDEVTITLFKKLTKTFYLAWHHYRKYEGYVQRMHSPLTDVWHACCDECIVEFDRNYEVLRTILPDKKMLLMFLFCMDEFCADSLQLYKYEKLRVAVAKKLIPLVIPMALPLPSSRQDIDYCFDHHYAYTETDFYKHHKRILENVVGNFTALGNYQGRMHYRTKKARSYLRDVFLKCRPGSPYQELLRRKISKGNRSADLFWGRRNTLICFS